ncbi:MAG: zinc-finger domain-containing protein [Burkholderiales bacterium]|nr:zinc-finger domain-containing protein [Burkholderiales bacterium]
MSTDTNSKSVVTLTAQDLQGPGVVFCPNPKMALWSNHPKVFIDVATTGEGKCAYCGTVYRLPAGFKLPAGH